MHQNVYEIQTLNKYQKYAFLLKASLGITCTFEDNNLCEIWHQDGDDSFDWTFTSGPTDTDDTGPTSGRGGGMDVSNKPKIHLE